MPRPLVVLLRVVSKYCVLTKSRRETVCTEDKYPIVPRPLVVLLRVVSKYCVLTKSRREIVCAEDKYPTEPSPVTVLMMFETEAMKVRLLAAGNPEGLKILFGPYIRVAPDKNNV